MLSLPKRLDAEILSTTASTIRFKSKTDSRSEQKIRFLDPSNGSIWGYLVVDDTRRGPGVGGIRIAQDLSLNEMTRLARTMTLKNSAACLPFGGGKSGLIFNPTKLIKEPKLKSDLMNLFAEALYPFDNYISAPDMGTNENDIQQIYEFNSKMLGTLSHTRGGIGIGSNQSGVPIDDWELTAHGLVAAINALETMDTGICIKGAHVVIQGYGNVGAPTASKLSAKGAIIVGASDINAGLWNPEGLNIEQLNRIRNIPGGLINYNGKTQSRFKTNQVDWLLEAPCQILVPAARPDAITARNADRIQCQVILQGANTPVNKMTEYYLNARRGIISLSDFIVNSGGIIGCAVEYAMKASGEYKKKVEANGVRLYTESLIENTVSKNVTEVLRQVNTKNGTDIIFREKALSLAKKRLEKIEDIWL